LQGKEHWEASRSANVNVVADLFQADLGGLDLAGIDLSNADLEYANLYDANLRGARLTGANFRGALLNDTNLSEADLSSANLSRANFEGAHLGHADLRSAILNGTNLSGADLNNAVLASSYFDGANLKGANFTGVKLVETVFANVDLTKTKGLESCCHLGPSVVDHRTLKHWSNKLVDFWKRCGLSDWQIESARLNQEGLTQEEIINITYEIARLRGEQPIQLFSPFISYSSKDYGFARHLYDDLQGCGVRCWFAPEDMKIGDRIRRHIDEVIHLHDKFLLILSENSVGSEWVEDEVEMAFEKERKTGGTMLFPIKLDNSVDCIETGWAAKIRRQRHIGDFTNNDLYPASLERVLRGLRATPQ